MPAGKSKVNEKNDEIKVCNVCYKHIQTNLAFYQHDKTFCSIECCKDYHNQWLIDHPPVKVEPARFIGSSHTFGGGRY